MYLPWSYLLCVLILTLCVGIHSSAWQYMHGIVVVQSDSFVHHLHPMSVIISILSISIHSLLSSTTFHTLTIFFNATMQCLCLCVCSPTIDNIRGVHSHAQCCQIKQWETATREGETMERAGTDGGSGCYRRGTSEEEMVDSEEREGRDISGSGGYATESIDGQRHYIRRQIYRLWHVTTIAAYPWHHQP